MNDEAYAPFLGEWLSKTEVPPPDPAEGTRHVMSRLSQSPQAGRWSPAAPPYVAGGVDRMLSAAKLAAAATIVATFGGVLLVGVDSAPHASTRSFAAGAPGEESPPAIHWQSAVVDLQADAMTLKVEDETYTTEGVEVVVDSYDGNLAQWQLLPRWVEDGQTFWLYLNFESDGEDWILYPWLWREGVIGPGDGEYENRTGEGQPEGDPPNAFVDFSDSSIRMPLGQPYVGDWTLADRIIVPTCDGQQPEEIEVTMTFQNLRLSVTPRPPTFLDQLAHDWFHRGSMLGDIFKGSLEPPRSRLLECPEGSAAP